MTDTSTSAPTTPDTGDDPYVWLEDVTGEDALDWVRRHNQPTVDALTGSQRFAELEAGALEVLDTDERIPYVRRRGEFLYNFWRDATNVRGLWRRTTMESYRTDSPDWDVLIDLDEVARVDGENWVWQGATVLPHSWDRALIWAMLDHEAGVTPTAASALEIQIGTPYRGQGLSPVLVGALRKTVAAQGISTLFAPVRPNGKTDPHQPMSEYAALTRPDGLPVDPWLRVHVRAGATIEKVAPASMVVPGSLQEWREWTGLPFDEDGDVVVPQALAPVRCHLAKDMAVYVEPNVWVRHGLA